MLFWGIWAPNWAQNAKQRPARRWDVCPNV